MVSVERVLLYLSAIYQSRPQKRGAGFAAEWRTAVRDVQAIEEHATFLSNKLQFNLDATLGLVSIEQNKIIKLFSVVSVVMMPPTLIASIYGMNFKTMPELNWELGYPLAIVMMIIAAVVPYVFFPLEALAVACTGQGGRGAFCRHVSHGFRLRSGWHWRPPDIFHKTNGN